MIFAFGVVTFLVLLLIFMVVKNQQNQKAIRHLTSQLRRNSRQLSHVASSTNMLTAGMQSTLLKRLQSAHKRGFVNEKDAAVLNHLFLEFEAVINACLQKGQTVDEALGDILAGEEVSLEDVKEVVKKYPKEVRLAWAKNSTEGFILSLTKMSELFIPSKSTEKPPPEQENTKKA